MRVAAALDLHLGALDEALRLVRLERHLDLTPEQSRELRQILDETRREAEAMRREMAPRMRQVMQRSEQRIQEILTPEQMQKYQEMKEAQKEQG